MLEQILAGIRVLDLTQNVAGPYCTQILGDLGADVVKVERPGVGDDTRAWRLPSVGGQSATFLALNRNKKSICIDLDAPDGQQIVRDLARSADVFVHSMKPDSMERRGLGHEDLKANNPDVIYCAISAFGQEGPMRGLPGYDPLMQAFTGIISTLGRDGEEPIRVSVPLIDMGTGMWSALGILAGLIRRAQSGRGARVDASLMDTGVGWMTLMAAGYFASGRLPRKLGSAVAMTSPYQLFRSADGHVFIAAGNDRLFERVCQGIGAPELARDPRFLDNSLRVTNRDALRVAIEEHTVSRSTRQLVAALRAAGAPCSDVNDTAQMLAHDQVQAAGMVVDLPIPQGPEHKVIALPLKMDGERGGSTTPPPDLGSDTDTVLTNLGCSPSQIARWRAEHVVA